MRSKRAAGIGPRAEQDRLPEGLDLRDVGLDVELGDIDEDPADDRVNQRPPVEGTHEPLAVGAGLDVAQVAAQAHAQNYGGSADSPKPAAGSSPSRTLARAPAVRRLGDRTDREPTVQ